MLEKEVPPSAEPIIVTNSYGNLLMTKRNREGVARYAFFHCPLDKEAELLVRLHATVWGLSEEFRWSNRASSIESSLARLPSNPACLVTSPGLLEKLYPGLKVPKGLTDIKVIEAPLPQGCAILAMPSPVLGVYTRIGDHLGLQFYNVKQTLVVIKVNDVVR